MKIKTPADNLILLPGEVLPRLKGASGTELKVLLYLYAKKEAEVSELAMQLGITPAEAEGALSFWRGAGLIEADDTPEKKPVPPSTSLYKSYDSYTIAEYREKDEAFRSCCELVAEKFGVAVLNKNELSSLLYLYNYVGLPGEVISGISAFCASQGKTSMQYLMKTALSMYEKEDIDTYEKFERYMARLEQLHSNIAQMRRLCGYGERALTSKEKEYFERWFEKWTLSFDLIRLAYEKTVDTLGKVNLAYMNAMLKRWYENGFTTVEDVQNKDAKPQEKNGAGGAEGASYGDSDAFFEAALKAGFEEA